MGCCFSRPSGPNSPYPGDPNSASARAINPPSVQQQQQLQQRASNTPPEAVVAATSQPVVRTSSAPSPPENAIPVQSRRRSRRENQPLDQHINKSLRRHVWTSRNRTWTRASIDRERADFFDTRVTGRPEVWQTLHAALQVLWDPLAQGADEDGTGGISTAQGFIDAAEVTLPTGDLAQGAYDALGNYYPLPEFVVADPDNLAEAEGDDDDEGTQGGRSAADGKEDDLTGIDEDTEEADEEASRRREEKGKAVVDVKDLMPVQARLSENGQDVTVNIGKTDAVRVLARKVQDDADLPSTKKVRIAYMGKILKENTSLVDAGWKPGHVVNALVFNK